MKARFLVRFALVVAVAMVGQVHEATAQTDEQEQVAELDERVEEFKTRLDLTPDQVERIRPILAESMEQIGAALKEAGVDSDGGGASELSRRKRIRLGRTIRGLQEEVGERMSEVLSDAQMEEYKKMQEERREELRARMQGNGDGFLR